METDILTNEQLKVLAEWEEGGEAWYRAACFKDDKRNEFDLMKVLAEEVLMLREVTL